MQASAGPEFGSKTSPIADWVSSGALHSQSPRYGGADCPSTVQLADGWRARRLLPETQLAGANGIGLGDPEHLYVASNWGSEISRVDLRTGTVSLISRTDNPVDGPDDVAYHRPSGQLFVSELFLGRVGVVDRNGDYRVLDDDVPRVNGITVSGDRLFIDEYRDEGRIFAFDIPSGERSLIAEGVDWPNGMSVSKDDRIYYPAVRAGQIWSIRPDGSEHRMVVDGLEQPTAVKAGPGGRIFAVEHAGRVISIDPESGSVTTVAQLGPGIDNLEFASDLRLLISNSYEASIVEIDPRGSVAAKTIVAPGLVGPFGVAVSPGGDIVLADGMTCAVIRPDGTLDRPLTRMSPSFKGIVRGVAILPTDEAVFTTANGLVVRDDLHGSSSILLEGLSGAIGVGVGPNGELAVAESETGRLVGLRPETGASTTLADGLDRPFGVCGGHDGSWFVAEAGSGHVTKVTDKGKNVVLSGLTLPHGVAVSGQRLFVLDRGTGELHCVSLDSGARTVVASGLPVAAAGFIEPKLLPGKTSSVGPGLWYPFSDIAVDSCGIVYIGTDRDGSAIAMREL